VFVGSKMLLSDVVKVPIAISLTVVLTLVGGAVALSLLLPRRQDRKRDRDEYDHRRAQFKH
jgi:tellurite resistance protein TerC